MVILFNKNNNLKISFFRVPLLSALLGAAPCQTRRLIRPVNRRNIANECDSAYFTSLARKKRPVRRDPLKKVALDKNNLLISFCGRLSRLFGLLAAN